MVNCPLTYNAILGRPVLNQIKAITLTYHLLMCFPIEKGIREIRGDQVAARECYIATLKGESSTSKKNISIEGLEVRDERAQVIAEPKGELEDIILDTDIPDGITQVGADLPKEFKA